MIEEAEEDSQPSKIQAASDLKNSSKLSKDNSEQNCKPFVENLQDTSSNQINEELINDELQNLFQEEVRLQKQTIDDENNQEMPSGTE